MKTHTFASFTKPLYRLFCLLLAALLLMGLVPQAVFAAAADEEGAEAAAISAAERPAAADEERRPAQSVTGSFFAFDRTISQEYPYEDTMFLDPSDVYSHSLARLSLGMALASFRDTSHQDEQDIHLRAILEEMGFSGIETDTFGTEPTSDADSIAYGIASKEIAIDGEEPFTVIAVGVCGGNYGAEWSSNLTVGDDTRSDGFEAAALRVEQAIQDYLQAYLQENLQKNLQKNLQDNPQEQSAAGDVKLWISGYSRAGAVSNITAADLTDSGLFADVYAYTFATPRTTKEPGNYKNIFNIIGTDDMVPKIPLADWGYQRYGTDLFTVSVETNTDCEEVLQKTAALYEQMVGSAMVINPEINYQLRILMDYLLMLIPDSESYAAYFQPAVLEVMNGTPEDEGVFEILMKTLIIYGEEDGPHREELGQLMEYLSLLINMYYLQGGIQDAPADRWDPQFGMVNLFSEHMPFKYLARMFASENPDEIFSDNTEYTRLVIYGNPMINIVNADRLVKTILPNGTELLPTSWTVYSLPDVDAYEDKLVITLPGNMPWTLSLYSDQLESLGYAALGFSADTVRTTGEEYYSLLTEPDRLYTIRLGTGDTMIDTEESDYTQFLIPVEELYSPVTSMLLENNSVIHLTIPKFIQWAVIVLAVLFAELIVYIVLLIIRKRKNRKRNTIAACIVHFLNVFLFGCVELALWYFLSIFPLLRMAAAFFACLAILLFAVRGYLRNRRHLKIVFLLAGLLILWLILDAALMGRWDGAKWLIPAGVYIVLFALGCFLWKEPAQESE